MGADTIKKLIIKIIISIVVVSAAVSAILIYNHNFKNNKAKDTDPESGEVLDKVDVNIILTDKDGTELINDILDAKDKTLIQLLDENYTIRYEESTFGAKLLDFESVTTDFVHSYIAIYVNDVYSNRGLSYIVLENNMKIEFRETKIR